MTNLQAKKIIKKTKRDYDRIAADFSVSRQKIWPEMAEFKKFVQPGDKILDLGCGNGRLLDVFADIKLDYLGVDQSQKLLELAREKFTGKKISARYDFKTADMLDLRQLPKNHFDEIFLIAVFQHVPVNFQLNLLNRIYQLLKANGWLLMTNWNLYQFKYWSFFIKKYLYIDKVGFFPKDLLIDWKNNQGRVVSKRYYHAFTKRELKKLFQETDFKVIRNHLSENKRNIVTIVQK